MNKTFISLMVLVVTVTIAQSYEIYTMEQERKHIEETMRKRENQDYILDVIMETDWWQENCERTNTMSDDSIIKEYKAWEIEEMHRRERERLGAIFEGDWVEECNKEMNELTINQ